MTNCPTETLDKNVLLDGDYLTVPLFQLTVSDIFDLLSSGGTVALTAASTPALATTNITFDMGGTLTLVVSGDDLSSSVLVTVEVTLLDPMLVILDVCTFGVQLTPHETDICSNSGETSNLVVLLALQSVSITVNTNAAGVSDVQ